MGTVNICIGPVTKLANDRGVYSMAFRSAENVTTSGTSADSTGTAKAGDIARVKAITGACYVGAPGQDAVLNAGWYLAEGDVIDLGGLREGDAVSVIEG